jgi:plasmid replication initiation protein
MERPFFSLAKRKRLKPIDYVSPDGKIWVKVAGHQDYGMATIWDADILIWAASALMELREKGANDAHSADPDQPFRPIVITDSGDPDHAVHPA